MQKNRSDSPKELGDVVSIIGPGMKIVGDCSSDGTIRVEGQVEGSVKAGKSVVVGKDGTVKGDITTQDAIIAGTVDGSVNAESRVELQSTCRVQGDIRSRRVKLDEGGQVDGQLHMGASATSRSGGGPKATADSPRQPGSGDAANRSGNADKSSSQQAEAPKSGR
ncbi:MAG: polymer-forming cytoskeletal protein [Gemmatimonadales bacterium]